VAGLGLACLCLLLVGGCSGSRLSDERNPYYLRGVQLLEHDKYQEAAEAFEKCLRLSPNSAKAHLQLGRLYDDVFTDPATAIYHYRCYLQKCPEGENAEAVNQWLARAEVAYLNDLLGRYPKYDQRSASLPSDAGKEAGEAGGSLPTERERKLAQRVKELTAELAALKQTGAGSQEQKAPEPNAPLPPTGPVPAAPQAGTTATPPPPEATPSAAKPEPVRVHVVGAGDTLSIVSRKFYGSLKYWPQLRDYNREILKGKDVLVPGMRIQVPPLAELQKAKAKAEPPSP